MISKHAIAVAGIVGITSATAAYLPLAPKWVLTIHYNGNEKLGTQPRAIRAASFPTRQKCDEAGALIMSPHANKNLEVGSVDCKQ
jgi:hypothetical protein